MVLTAHLFWYKVELLLYLERLSYLVVIHTLDRERKYKNKPNLGGKQSNLLVYCHPCLFYRHSELVSES